MFTATANSIFPHILGNRWCTMHGLNDEMHPLKHMKETVPIASDFLFTMKFEKNRCLVEESRACVTYLYKVKADKDSL